MTTTLETGSFGANITAMMAGKTLSHFEKNGLWFIIVATDGTAARVGWKNLRRGVLYETVLNIYHRDMSLRDGRFDGDWLWVRVGSRPAIRRCTAANLVGDRRLDRVERRPRRNPAHRHRTEPPEAGQICHKAAADPQSRLMSCEKPKHKPDRPNPHRNQPKAGQNNVRFWQKRTSNKLTNRVLQQNRG